LCRRETCRRSDVFEGRAFAESCCEGGSSITNRVTSANNASEALFLFAVKERDVA
jgi:hypothetical protein